MADIKNSTITIKQNGIVKGTFTLNQSSNATIELTDTNTDTKYSAGDGLNLTGTTFSVKTGFTTDGANRNYAVLLDANKKLYVNVPWTDTNTNTTYSAGKGLTLDETTFNVGLSYSSSGRNYAVQQDVNKNLYVNVPWTDNDHNTTYSAGTGLSLSGTTFNHSNSTTAKTSGFYKFSYDAQGHITGSSAVTVGDITDLDIPSNSTLSNYVTLNTEQHITALKHFDKGIHAVEKITSDIGIEGGYGIFTNKLSNSASQLKVESTNQEASITYQGTDSTWIVGVGCGELYSSYV